MEQYKKYLSARVKLESKYNDLDDREEKYNSFLDFANKSNNNGSSDEDEYNDEDEYIESKPVMKLKANKQVKQPNKQVKQPNKLAKQPKQAIKQPKQPKQPKKNKNMMLDDSNNDDSNNNTIIKKNQNIEQPQIITFNSLGF